MRFLFQPVSPYHINQLFAENKACISFNGEVTITCDGFNPPPGFKSQYGPGGHSGLDLHAKLWQPVYASQTGTVVEVSTEESRGLGVRIVTDDMYDCIETGKKEHFRYGCWHFVSNDVSVGDKVKVGDIIGYAGNTGNSSGVHVHFDLAPVEMNKGKWVPVLSNKTNGKVSPLPYMESIFALQFAGLWKRFLEISALFANLLADRMRGKSH